MAATGVDTTARGLLMLRPRLSLATAMVAMDMVAMAATGVDTTARGLLMPSPRLMLLLGLDTAMVATVVVMAVTAMARGLLSPVMAMAVMAAAMVVMEATATAGATATGVSYHRIRRSELSQKQNHKNSQCSSCENMKKKEIYLHGLF